MPWPGSGLTSSASFCVYDSTKAYKSGDKVFFNLGFLIANGDITANTAFAYGTTGATWRPDLSNINNNYTWKGVYAPSTAYAIGDVFCDVATTSGVFFRVTSGFTSTTWATDIAAGGLVSSRCAQNPASGIQQAPIYPVRGATSTVAGMSGCTPRPQAGQQFSLLSGNGTFDELAWIAYTPTIAGSTSNPTLATTKTLIANYRMVGKTMSITFTYYAASSTGAADGSGTYLFSLPSGFTINTTAAPLISTTANAVGNYNGAGSTALGFGRVSGATSAIVSVVAATSSTLALYVAHNSPGTAINTTVGSAAYNMATANQTIHFTAEVPIA